MKIVPKDSKLIYTINIFIVAFLVSGVFVSYAFKHNGKLKSYFFGTVHFRVASMIF